MKTEAIEIILDRFRPFDQQDRKLMNIATDELTALLSRIEELEKDRNELREIGERISSQDNAMTMNPMFCVQVRERIYGFDPQWSDNVIWIDTEDGAVEVDAPADGKETDFIIKSAYKDVWLTVMVAFTRKGCEEHLELNGHNYRHYKEVRIYVESFNRCPEMIVVRKYLESLGTRRPSEKKEE